MNYRSSHDEKWDHNFDEFKKFVKKYKIAYVPFWYRACNSKYKRLQIWNQHQRELFKNKKLSKYRINKLNAVGIIWKLPRDLPGKLSHFL